MRAAVLGAPVAHSLSPVLHAAAYDALGLDDWRYERVECDAASLPAFVASRDATWAGLSVTMPGKRAALDVADAVSTRAAVVGAANTLVRDPGGRWSADCTDVDGVAGALRRGGVPSPGVRPGSRLVVLGAGGTARAAVAAGAELGAAAVTVVVRDPARAGDARRVAEAVGLEATVVPFGTRPDLDDAVALVNTTPAGALDDLAPALVADLPAAAVVLDAVYHPWPTPLAAAALAGGLAVATGLDMLLWQAFGQVEQFTGRPAPRTAMHAALVAATGFAVTAP